MVSLEAYMGQDGSCLYTCT